MLKFRPMFKVEIIIIALSIVNFWILKLEHEKKRMIRLNTDLEIILWLIFLVMILKLREVLWWARLRQRTKNLESRFPHFEWLQCPFLPIFKLISWKQLKSKSSGKFSALSQSWPKIRSWYSFSFVLCFVGSIVAIKYA